MGGLYGSKALGEVENPTGMMHSALGTIGPLAGLAHSSTRHQDEIRARDFLKSARPRVGVPNPPAPANPGVRSSSNMGPLGAYSHIMDLINGTSSP